jgi:hypothetical protein
MGGGGGGGGGRRRRRRRRKRRRNRLHPTENRSLLLLTDSKSISSGSF